MSLDARFQSENTLPDAWFQSDSLIVVTKYLQNMPLQSDSTYLFVKSSLTTSLLRAWRSLDFFHCPIWLLEHRGDVSIVLRWNCWTVEGVSFFAIFHQEHGSVTAIFYHHRTLQIILIVFFFLL